MATTVLVTVTDLAWVEAETTVKVPVQDVEPTDLKKKLVDQLQE
jgi:hypothetical protein